jgi:Dolichyl-phosphate-mannose-protein mannosyltransferase
LTVELVEDAGRRRAPKFGPDHAFGCLLGVFVTLTLALSVLIPAWESNDEPDHFRNVQTLVSGRWYRMEPGAGYSAHQAPLYYLGLAAVQSFAGLSPFTPKLEGNPKAPEQGLYVHNDGDSQRRVVLLRFPSILLGALTVWLTRQVARRSGLAEWGAVLAAAIVATLPRFVFLSSVITNDTLVITLGAWATLLAVGLARDDEVSMKRLFGFGGLLGLMLETKLSAVPIVVALGVGVLIARWARPDRAGAKTAGNPTPQRGKLTPLKQSAHSFLVIAGGTLLIAGPILLANQLRYGDPLASKASVDYFRELLPPLVAVPHTWRWFGVAVSSGFATSFWYVSGWNQFRWKAETYVPLWFMAAVGLIGSLVKPRRVGASKRFVSAATLRARAGAHAELGGTLSVNANAGQEAVNEEKGQGASDTSAGVDAGVSGSVGEVSGEGVGVGAGTGAPEEMKGFEQGTEGRIVRLLAGVALASASVVWLLATQTTQWQARTSFPGLGAFATLIAIGYRRLRIPTVAQFLLPALTLAGTLYALHVDVVNRYFSS